MRGWLTVVASRICLDQVRSARARYERPAEIEHQAVAVNQAQRPDRPIGSHLTTRCAQPCSKSCVGSARASEWPSCCMTCFKCRST
ncbi:putative rNA polymerase sigma-70 factor [Mycobacterium xenopi 3993]|nr:putative rNA polymerase sigma-70 factor [Mycobacterium xenopi 3993]